MVNMDQIMVFAHRPIDIHIHAWLFHVIPTTIVMNSIISVTSIIQLIIINVGKAMS